MNIWTAKGEKIKFLGKNGTDSDLEDAFSVLTKGSEYTVEHISVDRCYSEVLLKEVPDKRFNTVMFENVNIHPNEVNDKDEYITWRGGLK